MADEPKERRGPGRPKLYDDHCVEQVAIAIAQVKPKWVIKRYLRQKWGIDGARTQETIISRAREFLRQSTSLPLTELLDRQRAFYEQMMGNRALAPKDRIRAAERLDRISGLDRADEPVMNNVEKVIKMRPVNGGIVKQPPVAPDAIADAS